MNKLQPDEKIFYYRIKVENQYNFALVRTISQQTGRNIPVTDPDQKMVGDFRNLILKSLIFELLQIKKIESMEETLRVPWMRCLQILNKKFVEDEISDNSCFDFIPTQLFIEGSSLPKSKQYLVLTQYRMCIFIMNSEEVQDPIFLFKEDFDVDEPFEDVTCKITERSSKKFTQFQGHQFYKLNNSTIRKDRYIIAIHENNQPILDKHFYRQRLQELKNFQLFAEQIKAQILLENKNILDLYSENVVGDNHFLDEDEFWESCSEFKRYQSLILSQNEKFLKSNDYIQTDFIIKTQPKEVKIPFNMLNIYRNERKKIKNIYLICDLQCNIDSNDEIIDKFLRKKPNKIFVRELKSNNEFTVRRNIKEVNNQFQREFQTLSQIKDLSKKSQKQFLKKGMDIDKLINLQLKKELQTQPEYFNLTEKIVSEEFNQIIEQNEGSEYFPCEPNYNLRKNHPKEIIKQSHQYWETQKQKFISLINCLENTHFIQTTSIESNLIQNNNQQLEQLNYVKEKDNLFQLEKQVSQEIKNLVKLFYKKIKQKECNDLEFIVNKLKQERIRIREVFIKELYRHDTRKAEMMNKKLIYEELQRLIERALNFII